jgi:Flp pilus assembly pilin Flp
MVRRSPLARHGAAHIEYVLAGGLVSIGILVAAQSIGGTLDRVLHTIAAPLAVGSGQSN